MMGIVVNREEEEDDILVVDDSLTSRTWTKLRLRQAGYAVREAESAEQALALIAERPPAMLLLDVILPDLDGFQLTRRLRQDPDTSDIPIVLVTALGDVESKVQGLEAGANDFLTKPPDEAELLARVRTLLRLKRSHEELLDEKNKTALLYRVSRELSAELDLDSLLARILELTIESLGASRGSIILLDEQGGVLRNIFSHHGDITSVTDVVRDGIVRKGLAGWVIQNRQGTLVPDTSQDPRWIALEDAHAATHSALAVPLTHEGRISGVLTLTHEAANRFTPAHLDLLDSIAYQAGIVIEKARTYLKEQMWARKLQFVHGVSHQVASILDPGQLLEDVAWLVRQTFDYYYVELALREEDALVFSGWNCGRERDVKVPPTRIPLADDTIVTWVARHGQPLLVPDVSQEPRYQPIPELPDTVAEMVVPLQAGGAVLGILDVLSDRRAQLTAEDIPLLEILASQVAVALVNAQLFETVERERGRLSAILTGTADAVVATDAGGRVILLNPAAERAFGASFADAAGRPLEEVLPYADLVKAFRQLQEKGSSPLLSELPLPDGRTFFFSVSTVAAGPRAEHGGVAVLQDITYLKELDRMKSEFVSTVSHDLRTPLTTIRGFAEMLLTTVQEDKQEFVRHIKNSAEQMADLVEDLLNLGKIEAGVEAIRVPCQLDQLAAEVLEEASFQALLHEVELNSTVQEAMRPVLGDPRQLRQVLDNLLGNAIKYTPTGGSIILRAREEDDRVMVEIEDTGIGIPREALPRLFEKFYRVPTPETDAIPGTGLGLAIVKAIIEQHGGQVRVDSEVGQGSTFAFSLPVHEEQPGQA